MAMVFSKDVLFIHVHKAGGTSVTRYLLETLPRPVFYVTAKELESDGDGVRFIHGNPHQRLSQARDFVRAYGFELAEFPLILAVVRNPYDISVSHYAWQRLRTTTVLLADSAVAIGCERQPSPQTVEVVHALRHGLVARIAPTEGETLASIREDIHRAAVRLGRRIETWSEDGVLYAAPTDRARKHHRTRQLAYRLDFREFVIEMSRKERSFLRGLFSFYHLDGVRPANLRMVRFEKMAEEIPAALAEAGIRGGGEFPWLNRTERGPWADYYDEETEAIVYEQARWLFDEGFYERLAIGSGG